MVVIQLFTMLIVWSEIWTLRNKLWADFYEKFRIALQGYKEQLSKGLLDRIAFSYLISSIYVTVVIHVSEIDFFPYVMEQFHTDFLPVVKIYADISSSKWFVNGLYDVAVLDNG